VKRILLKQNININNRVILFIFLLLFIFFPVPLFAATININAPSTNSVSETNWEYQANVDLTIDVTNGTVYYLRGVFHKDGTSNYCGYTWNGSEWYSGPISSNEGWKKFLSITIASNSASTILKTKFDPTQSGCKETGNYKFKVQRYTVSGSSSFDTQDELSVEVNVPTPFPTATPTPGITHITHIPTNTTVKEKPTITSPSQINSPTIGAQNTSSNTIVINDQNDKETDLINDETNSNDEIQIDSTSVLGASAVSTGSTNQKEIVQNTNSRFVVIFLTVSGLFFLLSGLLWMKKQKQN
jgi:hypothetical protein